MEWDHMPGDVPSRGDPEDADPRDAANLRRGLPQDPRAPGARAGEAHGDRARGSRARAGGGSTGPAAAVLSETRLVGLGLITIAQTPPKSFRANRQARAASGSLAVCSICWMLH